jgi:hypothetical protein
MARSSPSFLKNIQIYTTLGRLYLLQNVAIVVVGEVGRSAVYMRYNNGPRTALGYITVDWTQGVVRRVNFDKKACCANMIGGGGNN